ncbi:MAG: phosphoribosylanthranilate isomerase [Limnochordaceae bacterium]|nr:phosphoribosylanthranilate isomerase [Limnochordaceae bacterium]
MKVWVKICGLTREEDVVAAVRAGADAVGVVLTPKSPRAVGPERARELALAAREEAARAGRRVDVVGVFTQEPIEQIEQQAHLASLDVVQLHGVELPEGVQRLPSSGLRCIRALWPSGSPVAPAGAWWALLLDSGSREQPGGTGRPMETATATEWVRVLGAVHPRVILAGGLRPGNVVKALEAARPWGVDVSSGVEQAGRPGVKDRGAIEAFVATVRAWEERRLDAGTRKVRDDGPGTDRGR